MDVFQSKLGAAHKVSSWCPNVSRDNGSSGNSSHPSSAAEYDARYVSTLGTAGDYIVAFYLLCIIASSVVTNSCVIWSLAVRKTTAVCVDYYILTLAISDICSPVFAYPMTLWSMYSHRWSFGYSGCLVNGFLGFFFGIVDIFILSTLSVSRYVCVCRPLGFSEISKRKVVWSLVGVGLLSIVWAAMPLVGWGSYKVEPFGTSCTLDWSTPDRSYITCVFLCCLALPLLVMLSCYGSILQHTRTASRRLRKYNMGGTRRARHETKLIKVMLVMTLFFLLAWMPYAVVAMMSAYSEDALVTGPTVIVPTLLAKTSHLSNPVIYITMNGRSSSGSLCCRIAVFLARSRRSSPLSNGSAVLRMDRLRGGKRNRGRSPFDEAESAASATVNNCTVVSNAFNLVVTSDDCDGSRVNLMLASASCNPGSNFIQQIGRGHHAIREAGRGLAKNDAGRAMIKKKKSFRALSEESTVIANTPALVEREDSSGGEEQRPDSGSSSYNGSN